MYVLPDLVNMVYTQLTCEFNGNWTSTWKSILHIKGFSCDVFCYFTNWEADHQDLHMFQSNLWLLMFEGSLIVKLRIKCLNSLEMHLNGDVKVLFASYMLFFCTRTIRDHVEGKSTEIWIRWKLLQKKKKLRDLWIRAQIHTWKLKWYISTLIELFLIQRGINICETSSKDAAMCQYYTLVTSCFCLRIVGLVVSNNEHFGFYAVFSLACQWRLEISSAFYPNIETSFNMEHSLLNSWWWENVPWN